MKKEDVIDHLANLSERELIETLYDVFSRMTRKHVGARSHTAKMVLAKVLVDDEEHERDGVTGPIYPKTSDNRGFYFRLLGTFDPEFHPEGAEGFDEVCQDGECCGFDVSSYVKDFICPICGHWVHGT